VNDPVVSYVKLAGALVERLAPLMPPQIELSAVRSTIRLREVDTSTPPGMYADLSHYMKLTDQSDVELGSMLENILDQLQDEVAETLTEPWPATAPDPMPAVFVRVAGEGLVIGFGEPDEPVLALRPIPLNDMTKATRHDALAPLEPLVGNWMVESPLAPGVQGKAGFEWTLERQFLVQRVAIPVEGAPESMSIIALDDDGETFTMHYFDSRGIVRVYAMTIDAGVWTLERHAPDFSPLPFHQRYSGSFAPDGGRIDGRWETSEDGESWKLDFELAYIRAQ
jgi:hypothetical protein